MNPHARYLSLIASALLFACAGDDSPGGRDAGGNALPNDMSDGHGEDGGQPCRDGSEWCAEDDGDAGSDAGDMGDEAPDLAVCGKPLPNRCGPAKNACALGQACFANACSDPFSSRAWVGDVTIPQAPDGNGALPVMAINAKGSAAVVWDRDLNGHLDLTVFDAETRTWGPPLTVTAPDTYNANGEDVTVDPDGNVYVVWQEGQNEARYTKARRYDAETKTLEITVPLHEGTIDFMEARVGSDPSGNVMVVYAHPPKVDAQRYDAATGKWGTPVQIDLPNGIGGWDVDLVVDRFGAATAVWVQRESSASEAWQNTYAARFDPKGKTWSKPTRIDVTDTGNDNHPHLAADPFGNVVVTWHEGVMYDYTTAWAVRYDAACGKWSTAQRIDQGNNPDVFYTDVGVDAKGNAVAIWIQDGSLYSASYDASTDKWVSRGKIPSSSTGDEAQLSVDPSGHAVAVFQGSSEVAMHTRFDPVAATWSAPVAIDRGVSDRSFHPLIGVDGQGRFIGVWSQLSSQKYKIRSNRLE